MFCHLQTLRKILHMRALLPSGLISIVNFEFGNRQLLQRGKFLAAFVSRPTHPAGNQMFAQNKTEQSGNEHVTSRLLEMIYDVLGIFVE